MYNKKLKICCICGKAFYPAVMHIYKKIWKKKVYMACSYTCYTKLEETIEKEKREKRQQIT